LPPPPSCLKLEKSEEIYKAVWAHKYKPTGISEAKKRINNKFKGESAAC
jgi:hypothetical protein